MCVCVCVCVLSVVQNIPIPEDGAHTATIIPAVLDCMRGKFPTLKQWGKWVLEEQKASVWHPRVHIDGDLLQVFAALVMSQFYSYEWPAAAATSSSNDDSEESTSSDRSSKSSDSNSGSSDEDSDGDSTSKE